MKTKNCFLILFLTGFLFSIPSALAQEKKASQRRLEKYQEKNRGETIDDLLDEGNELKEKNPREALDKIEEALGVSLANEDVYNEGRSYVLLGEINERIEEWRLALDNYTRAYEILKTEYASSREFKKAIQGVASTNLKLGNHQEALRYYQEALSLSVNENERWPIQLGISEVYFQLEDYPRALQTVEEISVSKKISSSSILVSVENQKAKIYARMNEMEKAKDALQSSQNTARSNRAFIPQKQEDDLKEAKDEVANVLHDQQRYDEEISLRSQSIEYNLDNNNLPEVSKDKVGISKALAAKGETSAAIKELEEAALIADTINDPKQQSKAFLALASLYEKNGRQAQALSTYKRYSEAVNKSEELNQTKLLEKADLLKKQKDIEEVTKDIALGQQEEKIAETMISRQRVIIYGLLLIILIIGVTSYFIYKNAQASKVANQLLALKSLRSQMNPHFIFNALNSVNQFVAQNDERTANKFLSEFSRLMRLVLENSQEDFIPLDKEQEIISLYLKLEHYRFRDKFDYEIKVDESINPETFEIPPMLLQPYIENAVWHGLRYKESKGKLKLEMRKNSHGMQVEITDNGIGRKRSAELKTINQKKQSSTGLKNIQERLSILNKVYKSHYRVEIGDLDVAEGTGTRVLITIPEHSNGKS